MKGIREVSFYSDWAMARDVIALIEHLHLDAVDVVGFSMGAGTLLVWLSWSRLK